MIRRLTLAALILVASAGAAPAQQPVQLAGERGVPASDPGAAVPLPEKVDIIMPHITDSRALELPCFNAAFACHVELPHWAPIQLGPLTLDLSPTKHVVFLLLSAVLVLLTLGAGARAAKRSRVEGGPPRGGFANGIEAMVLYLRNEVVLPNVGHHGDKYVPFILTLFFFILFANLLGLVPYGSTATGNINVTATLAIVTFVMIEIAGMRALGRKYIGTIVYWPHDMPLAMKIPMTLIMTPVEIIGKFTKPFALMIRLFANMTAGHVIVLALIGLIFTFGIYVFWAPFAMAIGIMILEIFIAFLQAFVFALLASVFIGQIREAAH